MYFKSLGVTGKELQLQHRAPVVHMTVVDRHAQPLPGPLEVTNGRAKAPDMGSGQQLVVVSEEQFKVRASAARWRAHRERVSPCWRRVHGLPLLNYSSSLTDCLISYHVHVRCKRTLLSLKKRERASSWF